MSDLQMPQQVIPITNDPATWPRGDKVWNVCRAIAMAEGANVGGSAPDKYNNPGDLSKGDEHGQGIFGYTILPDGEEEIIFGNKRSGWAALYTKIANIVTGKSKTYQPTMTWRQIAQKYAGDSQDWVNNVTHYLGVDPESVFENYFNAKP